MTNTTTLKESKMTNATTLKESKMTNATTLKEKVSCSFCGATAAYRVRKISGHWIYICEKCLDVYM